MVTSPLIPLPYHQKWHNKVTSCLTGVVYAICLLPYPIKKLKISEITPYNYFSSQTQRVGEGQ